MPFTQTFENRQNPLELSPWIKNISCFLHQQQNELLPDQMILLSYGEAADKLCGYSAKPIIHHLTSFTGSSACLILTADKSLLLIDPRYTLQALEECQPLGIQVQELPSLSFSHIVDFLKKHEAQRTHTENQTIYYDEFGLTFQQLKTLQQSFQACPLNLMKLASSWSSQQARPKKENLTKEIEPYELCYAGYSAQEKIEQLVDLFRKNSSFESQPFEDQWGLILTSPESIAWLLNLRAKPEYWKIPFSPTFPSLVLITRQKIFLYLNNQGLEYPESEALTIEQVPSLFDFGLALCRTLKELNLHKIFYTPAQISAGLMNQIQKFYTFSDSPFDSASDSPSFAPVPDYAQNLKAIKSTTEIEAAIPAFYEESLAIIRTLFWLESEVSQNLLQNEALTEWDVAEHLEYERKKSKLYQGPSFSSIIASGVHAAVVHYSPTKNHCGPVKKDSVLLMDVGGHYLGGTTDMTRTIWIGDTLPLNEIKKVYTLVLKGHIALASTPFYKETKGCQLDILARQFLWQEHLDYQHGTGHGIGNNLAVHEGPHSISRNALTPLKENMLVTDEPGFYQEGLFGVRLENVLRVLSDSSPFLKFSALTLVPFEKKLIDFSLLTQREKQWLKHYHQTILDIFFQSLSQKEWTFLKEKCFF